MVDAQCVGNFAGKICNLRNITALALVDAINPCAIAVLAMVLLSIMSQDPKKRKKVLAGGIAFVSAVYVGYLFYGLVMIHVFKAFADFLRENSGIIYNSLAILAMIIGALNLRDYFSYTPGGIATEMPLWMRPKVKKIISGITSPKGAFIIGFIVTIFLLPCTIGPYIIASGLMSSLGIFKALPWLLYYNFIFILPMLFTVGIVYYGFTKVEEVSGWKEKNIRYLHLIEGILLLLVGVSILFGWL